MRGSISDRVEILRNEIFFLKNHTQNVVEKLFPEPFLENLSCYSLLTDQISLFDFISMCIAIVCWPSCDVISVEINLFPIIRLYFYMTKKSRQKCKYLENEMSFQDEIKSIFHHFQKAVNDQIKQICLEGESPTLIKLQTFNFIKKKTLAQVFSRKFCYIFHEHLFQNVIVFFHLVQIGNERSFLLHEVLPEKLQSSRSKIFFNIGALENFAVFTGKHLCWDFF